MGIHFAAVPASDTTNAYHAKGDKTGFYTGAGSNTSKAGALWGRVYNLGNGTHQQAGIGWSGGKNFPTGDFSVLIRIRPFWSGAPGETMALFALCGPGHYPFYYGLALQINSDGNLKYTYGSATTASEENTTVGDISSYLTNDTPADILVTVKRGQESNGIKFYCNGNLIAQFFSKDWSGMSQMAIGNMHLGVAGIYSNNTNISVEEFAIFDSIEAHAPYSGPSRTTPLSVSALDGLTWPAEADVEEGTLWNQYGVQKTGTLEIPASSTDPGESNVKHGVDYTFEGDAKEGTYRGADLWTDPLEENVLLDTEYLADGNEKTGTFDPALWSPNLRTFLNNILKAIGTATLTDEEFDTVTVTEKNYSIETYNDLLAVIDSRQLITTMRDRLRYFFISRGTEIATSSTAKSNIFIGAGL